MRFFLLLFFYCGSLSLFAQNNNSHITGSVIDENEKPLSNVSISVLGQKKNIISSDSGTFYISTPSNKPFALLFSHTGFFEVQKKFTLNPQETEKVIIKMQRNKNTLESVIITDERERKEAGLIKMNAKDAFLLPSASGGIEAMIKTLVGSNNELTSQYSVRGGNYDENLVYINDFEIYRPYLVSNGQQEGLSFINPELIKNVNFYTGGFQAKYGDKMSSVLDIQYKKPAKFEGSAYISLLEQGISVSGTAHHSKATYIIGLRNKSNQSLLSNQPTVGSYSPSAYDVQALITYKLSEKIQFELLNIFSNSSFTYYPEFVKKTSSVFSPFFTANLGLDTYFNGQEKDSYNTSMTGATLIHSPTKKIKLKWLISRFTDAEKENYDIGGAYLFGDRDFDNNSSTFGQIINPLGSGYYQDYARNSLSIETWNFAHRGSYELGNHFFQWGNTIEQTNISDKVNEFQYQDSAGYSLPNHNNSLELFSASNSSNNLSITKYNGYIQDNWHFGNASHDLSIQGGVRYHYNNLNKELLISPRIQASWKPSWKKDLVFKIATGIYDQPPFYREFRGYDGNLHLDILSQKSTQFVAGLDYQFKAFNNLPFRLSMEGYYKQMTDVIPYDIDNVKIRYYGNNQAKAYATGVELRLFSELIKDAESWLSLGFMETKEDLFNDYYYNYYNASGEMITSSTKDKIPTDSAKIDIGYVRRPSDRFMTIGLFVQDYLATNKNIKLHINMLYGSEMPFNVPNNPKYRNALDISSYIRVDIGISARLLGEKNTRRSHSPFKNIDNIWASLEIFNVIDKANTISYQLIKDFANNSYAIPNRLTPRMLNVKLIAKF